MVTFGDVRRWNADAIEHVGVTVRARKDSLIGLSDELASAALTWRWHGGGALEAKKSLRRLNDRAEHLVAEASAVQRALFAASDDVAELRQQVLNLEAYAASWQFDVAANGAIVDKAPDRQSEPLRFAVRDRLRQSVREIVRRAAEIDRELAKVLNAAVSGKISDRGATSLAMADQNIQSHPDQLTPEQILERYQVDPDRMTSFFGKDLPASEVEMLQEMGLLHELGVSGLYDFYRLRSEAFGAADERFPSTAGKNDDHNDAFRHAYWNARMVQEYGADWAARYATAHERVPGNRPEREAMDLHNNEVGRKIAVANPGASPQQLAGLIEDAVRRGDMVVMPRAGGLDYSDRVPQGMTAHPTTPAPEPEVDAGSGTGSDSGSAVVSGGS